MTDTDSVLAHIKTEDISQYIQTRFDPSNSPPSPEFKMLKGENVPTGMNKKVLGVMKDKIGQNKNKWTKVKVYNHMKAFARIGPKNYAYIKDNENQENRCKGISKACKEQIKFQDCKSCVLWNKVKIQKTLQIASKPHNLKTIKCQKIALENEGSKRQRFSKTETSPLGEVWTKEELFEKFRQENYDEKIDPIDWKFDKIIKLIVFKYHSNETMDLKKFEFNSSENQFEVPLHEKRNIL